jgi:hypothetical protein
LLERCFEVVLVVRLVVRLVRIKRGGFEVVFVVRLVRVKRGGFIRGGLVVRFGGFGCEVGVGVVVVEMDFGDCE